MEGGARPRRWFFSARVLGCLPVMEAVLTEELDEEEQLVRRHRKEKKELQGDGGAGNPGVARTQGRERGGSFLGNVEGLLNPPRLLQGSQ